MSSNRKENEGDWYFILIGPPDDWHCRTSYTYNNLVTMRRGNTARFNRRKMIDLTYQIALRTNGREIMPLSPGATPIVRPSGHIHVLGAKTWQEAELVIGPPGTTVKIDSYKSKSFGNVYVLSIHAKFDLSPFQVLEEEKFN